MAVEVGAPALGVQTGREDCPQRLPVGYWLPLMFPSSVALEDRFVVTLHAYMDESGTHRGSKALCVAGYISSPERWVAFEREWYEALYDFDIGYFHMTDFAVKAPPYDTWTREQRISRLSRLIEIINRSAYASVGIGIPLANYKIEFSAKAKRAIGSPYGLAAAACFMEFDRLVAARSPTSRIAYVFDILSKGTGPVKSFFESNERRKRLRLLSLRYEPKTEFLPLQAADILAYELYKHLPRQLGSDLRLPRTRHLRLLAEVEHVWGFLGVNELRKWSDIVETKDEAIPR
ncbi:MAG: hypothetical protein QOH06_2909 [Acidobacteriota bacterium]|jgi:hypothetical protein|nr:hypothetical protein [Acidobacteriota bacterium]